MRLACVHCCIHGRAHRLLALLAAGSAVLLGGCAVYPAPAVAVTDGTLAYSSPPAVLAPAYPVLPYTPPPYYVGPPVSLDLWFGHGGGHHHSWGRPYGRHYGGHGGGHRHGGFHRDGGGRHR